MQRQSVGTEVLHFLEKWIIRLNLAFGTWSHFCTLTEMNIVLANINKRF